MRKVYHPQSSSVGLAVAMAAGVALTATVFCILPFSHMVATPARQLEIRKTGAVDLPPPAEDLPPPPPQQEAEKPPEAAPELKLAEAPRQQISLSADLEVAVGSGGALQSMAASAFNAAAVGADVGKDLAVFDVADLDKQPELVAAVSPAYPNDMRRAKVEGSVVILFVLTEDGQVEDPRVERSSRSEFERPALDAVRKWKFRPGARGGESVRTYMRLPIAFRLSS